MPLMASSTLSAIGWEKLNITPGILVTSPRMASTSRTLVRPAVQSSSGCRWMNVSLWLGPIVSVPSSGRPCSDRTSATSGNRSEEHTSELQSLAYLVCRLLLEKKKNKNNRDETLEECGNTFY